ncbi:MAG: T9SS type A sorting domain-containing protein [Bacteroidales bacterium]|nr:T9SS type A sorting domain-containing protein [Bacteroidales bacterium]
MKNRLLPFGLITAFVAFAFLCFSPLLMAGHPGNPDLKKKPGSSFLESIRANQHTGIVDPLDFQKAHSQAASFRTKSATGALNLDWISIGPNNYPGKVWTAIFDNTDPTGLTIIAGAEAGGIWESINYGLTWSMMSVENNAVLKVSSLVQTSNGTIYAATGITNCKQLSLAGNGIYKSENGGSFTVIPATKYNPDFAGITKLVVDPSSGRLFAATIGGLYFSDNGNDWIMIKQGYTMDVCVGSDGTVITAVGDSAYLSVGGDISSWVTLTTGETNLLPNTGIGWMVFAIAPSDANVMYASLAKTDGKLLNVYCSTDKGATWSVVFPNNPSYEPFAGSGCYANTLAVVPDDPNQIYLGGLNMWYGKRVQQAGYFSWTEVSSGLYSPWLPNSAPALHHSYMFRPNSNKQILLATDGGVCTAKIINNGVEFQTSNKELATSEFTFLSFSSTKNYVMGGGENIGSLALGYYYPTRVNDEKYGFPVIQPTGLYEGQYSGNCAWSNLDNNIGVFTLFGSTTPLLRRDFRDLTYDNDFMNGLTSLATNLTPMTLWESFTFTQTRDSVKYYAREINIPADSLIQITSANGIKFPYLTTAPILVGDSIIVADPVASRFFFYGNKADTNYKSGIFMTKDMLKFYKKPEYFVVLKDTAKVDFITTMAVSTDLNTLWAGTEKGRLLRVTGLINANDSLTANAFSSECVLVKDVFINPAFTDRYITSISIDSKNTNRVLITLGNYGNQDYVYYTTDGNSSAPTFNSVQSNLPQAAVYSGLIELNGSNAIVGTDVGVFSTDNLASGSPEWGSNMENIGDVIVTDIQQQKMHDFHIQNYGVLYLASYGRGLWMDTTFYAPVGIPPVIGSNCAMGSLTLNPNPAKDNFSFTCTNETSTPVMVIIYDLTGRQVFSKDFGTQQHGSFTGEVNLTGLPSGTYLVKVGNAHAKLIKL